MTETVISSGSLVLRISVAAVVCSELTFGSVASDTGVEVMFFSVGVVEVNVVPSELPSIVGQSIIEKLH